MTAEQTLNSYNVNIENMENMEYLEHSVFELINKYKQLQSQYEQLNTQYQAVKSAYTDSIETNKKVEQRIKNLLDKLTGLE